jgi:DNA-binding SARP family transcriptional activator
MRPVMNTPGSAGPRSAAAPTSARLLLRVAGQLAQRGRAAIDLEPKDALLLAYLAVEGPTPRSRLATLLWPDVDEERARGNLRQRLLRLKRTTGVELVTGNPLAQLAPGIEHDLTDTRELLSSIEPHQAAGLAEWLDAQRSRRHRSHADWLDAACTQAEAEGDLAAALEHANALVQLDPLSEHAHRRVMKLHYLRGDTAAAMAAYERCRRILAAELGASPGPETRELLRQVERGSAQEEPTSARRALPLSLLRPPRLIGREPELAALERAWASHRTVLLVGEAGVGKTRLLEEFAARAPTVLLVRARPGDADEPLATAAHLLHAVAARFEDVVLTPAYARCVDVLPGHARGASERATRRTPLGPQFAAALTAARELAGLIVDDLQFADDASVDLLWDLRHADDLADLRWAFASRPPAGPAADARLARLRESSEVDVVALGHFDEPTLEAFIWSLGLAGVEAGDLAAEIHRRVGGNPLFVLEVLRQSNGCAPARQPTPLRVSQLMDRRLQSVSESALALARIAAIAGRDFSAELAEVVSGQDALTLASPWRELEAAQLFTAGYFSHDLVLEAAQRSIPGSIAPRLHARVADFLQARDAEPAKIAHHRLAAGQDALAVPHLLAAARRAWLAARAQETTRFFLRAAEIECAAGRREAAFDILFDCADAISETSTVEQFSRVVAMARPLASTPVQQATLRLLEAVEAYLLRDFEGLCRMNDEALLMAIRSGATRVEAECRFNKGYIAVEQGRLQDGIEHFAAAARLARACGATRRAEEMDASLLAALSMSGQLQLAGDQRSRVQQRLVETGSPATVAMSQSVQASDALALGDAESAQRALDQALATMRRIDVSEPDRESVVRNAINCLRRMGRFSAALVLSEEIQEHRVADERAQLLLTLGRPDLAMRAVDAGAQRPAASERRRIRMQLAQAALQLGLGRDARPLLEGLDPTLIGEQLIAWETMMLCARLPGSEALLRQATALVETCERGRAAGLLPSLRAAKAKLAADMGRKAAAADLRVAGEWLTPERRDATVPQCALWLYRSFGESGERAEASRCLLAGKAWLQRTVDEDVPPEFRDAFLSRNPIHRELLSLATRRR